MGTCRKSKALGVVVLVDCADINFSELWAARNNISTFVGFMSKYGEKHFPDSIWNCVVFNAPTWAERAFNTFFKAALSKATASKIQIVSVSEDEKEKKKIQEIMDLEVYDRLRRAHGEV